MPSASSNWSYFSVEYDWLKMVLSRLSYPDRLINSTVSRFIAVKPFDHPVPELPAVNSELNPVRVVLPFIDQASADIVRAQLKNPWKVAGNLEANGRYRLYYNTPIRKRQIFLMGVLKGKNAR